MSTTEPAPAPQLSESEVQRIVDAAIGRWADDVRARIPEFVTRNFGLRGSLRLHRRALGWDLARAPVNAVGGIATATAGLLAAGLQLARARRAAAKLRSLNLLLDTAVGRELEWRLHTELLGLPLAQGERVSRKDLLLEEVLRDPGVMRYLAETLGRLGDRSRDEAFQQRLRERLSTYVGSRVAAGEITVGLVALGSGLVAYKQLTPGVAALSGSIAGTVAYQTAVSGFWAGPWLGSVYYGMVGVSTPPLLTAGVFGALLVPATVLAAFAGVVTDPLQRRLGLHRRRLERLVDSLEAGLRGEERFYAVRDHYVARLLDLADWVQAALRVGR